jgi:hypothetical protein
MTRLRQQMIDAMRQRGYSVRTHQAYLAAVTSWAAYCYVCSSSRPSGRKYPEVRQGR